MNEISDKAAARLAAAIDRLDAETVRREVWAARREQDLARLHEVERDVEDLKATDRWRIRSLVTITATATIANLVALWFASRGGI